jgi:hypothetical protein
MTSRIVLTIALTACALIAVTPAGVVDGSSRPLERPLPATQAGAQCAHGADETQEQATRRRQALLLARVINTVQARARYTDQKVYLANLGAIETMFTADGARWPLTPGWDARLVASSDGYALILKDTLDPCSFAYVTDDSGLIYRAEPIG